jgi:hypothetical protein
LPITKKQRVRDFVTERGWSRIGEAEWAELRRALPDVSETTLRGCGLPIESPWDGIRQHTLDELEASLLALSVVYGNRADLQGYCRQQVVAAKDRARGASRSVRLDPERRRLKSEMVDWMLVWLGDPGMFAAWARARRAVMNSSEPRGNVVN